MENQKNNKGVIALLIIIIIILSVLCVLFATGTIELKTNKGNNNSEQNSTEIDMDKTVGSIINKLIGSYTYKGEYVGKNENYGDSIDIWKNGKMAFEELQLNDSGYAEASAGNERAGGYSAKGKWYISNNDLIIVNEKCKAAVINGNVEYPNCNPIWTYTLKEENGTIILTSSNNSMAEVTLNKVNN